MSLKFKLLRRLLTQQQASGILGCGVISIAAENDFLYMHMTPE